MCFSDDLVNKFDSVVNGSTARIDEVFLFETLANSIQSAASSNGINAEVLKGHGGCFACFHEMVGIPFYSLSDRGNAVYCELCDLMFIVFNNYEARLTFMQNKYDRKITRNDQRFKATSLRQFYLMKNRPEFYSGKRMNAAEAPIKIIRDSRFSSVTNYGVFVKDSLGYTMKYYNAEFLSPCGSKKVEYDITASEYSSIDDSDDQLNTAKDLHDFATGLIGMKIGKKYCSIDELLTEINTKDVIDKLRANGCTTKEFDSKQPAIKAKYYIIVDLSNRQIQQN